MTSLLRRIVRRRVRVASGVVMAAIGIVAVPHKPADVLPDAPVLRQPFVDTLVESGTISAERLMLYGSPIAGAQVKIAELAPEGRAVAAGDLLVRFDATPFEQGLARESAALRQAEADLLRAREDLRLEQLRASGDADGGREQVARAERGLANQVEGRGKLELAEAEAAAAEAARERDRARTAVDDLKPLLAEGFVTRAEVERSEQALARAEEQRRLADLRRETLARFERPAATSRAEAEVHTARQSLTRDVEAARSRAAGRAAAVAAAQSRMEEIRARVTLLEQQIARTVVRADAPGLIVYRDLFFGSDRRKPQIGDEVWSNQPLIAVPDASHLTVDTRVREIDLRRLSPGQPVTVRVDAYPDVSLRGRVALIGALAQADPSRAGTKFFPVTIQIVDADARLRTGMTAEVDIRAASLPAALVVPQAAIFGEGPSRYVVVLRRQPVREPVAVVAANDTHAAIAGAVQPGERVLLVDPTPPQPAIDDAERRPQP